MDTQDTEQKEVVLAVVGLGKMGVMHAAMASACPGVRVGALVDDDAKLGAHVRSMGIQAPFYDDLARAAAEEGLDGVVLATPSHTHRALAEAAFDAGLDVLCEKPLANSLEDAEAMAQAAAKRPGLCAGVGFMKGHQDLFLNAARTLRAGALGEVRRFRASVYLSQVFGPMEGWTFDKERAGGGVLINTGIHLIHLCSLLFGRVAAVTCKARSMHSEVEDTLTAILEFENGAFGSVDISWSVPGYDVEATQVAVEGSNGAMELDDRRCRLHLLQAWNDLPKGWSTQTAAETERAAFTLTPDYCGEGYYNEMADFAEAIQEDRQPRYAFSDGLEIQRIVDAMYRSSQSAERIELKPPAGLATPKP